MSDPGHPYDALTPDVMLDAVERFGVRCDGTFIALNSYENRVYQVGIEDAEPLVAKFYRPNRWPPASILEEHEFGLELAEREIPVIAPLRDEGGHTLLEHRGFHYALYQRRGGRWPELDRTDVREWLGRFLGRIHAVGAVRRFSHRPAIDARSWGDESQRYLIRSGLIPEYLSPSFQAISDELLTRTRQLISIAGTSRTIRLHGDCHPSNILWTEQGPHFVDLDDCRTGPAVQDIWMLLSGEREERTAQLADILTGYCEFHDFDASELILIEALRSLRILHYSAWLARRWDDPAFPHNFPWFNTTRYWEGQIETLQEQCDNLVQPALEWVT